jgi:hypothetical protein
MSGITLSELARRIGRDRSLVSRWAKSGRIPRRSDGLFDEAAVRRVLKGSLDPARAKPLAPVNTSTVPSRSVNTHGPSVPLTLEESLKPKAEDYRDRRELGDDFMRGLFFGLHRLAFDMPVCAASDALSAGAPARVGYTLKAMMQESVFGVMHDVCREIGIVETTNPDPYFVPPHLVPPAFYNISPQHLASIAGEPIDMHAWEQWRHEMMKALDEA